VYTLKAWADSLGGLKYPLCSDFWPHGEVARAYGVFNEEVGRPERAIFVVDAGGIVRYIDVHQLREVPDEEEIAQELEKCR
jgi:peroxiredoxin